MTKISQAAQKYRSTNNSDFVEVKKRDTEIPQSAGEIFDDRVRYQGERITQNRQDYQKRVGVSKQEAENARKAEAGGASYDRAQFGQNAPDNIGLNGELSETSRGRAYNAYRNRLAAAKRARDESHQQLDYLNSQNKHDTVISRKDMRVGMKQRRHDEYWKNRQWKYQLAADEKAKEAERLQTLTLEQGEADDRARKNAIDDQKYSGKENIKDKGVAGGGYDNGGGGSWGENLGRKSRDAALEGSHNRQRNRSFQKKNQEKNTKVSQNKGLGLTKEKQRVSSTTHLKKNKGRIGTLQEERTANSHVKAKSSSFQKKSQEKKTQVSQNKGLGLPKVKQRVNISTTHSKKNKGQIENFQEERTVKPRVQIKRSSVYKKNQKK